MAGPTASDLFTPKILKVRHRWLITRDIPSGGVRVWEMIWYDVPFVERCVCIIPSLNGQAKNWLFMLNIGYHIFFSIFFWSPLSPPFTSLSFHALTKIFFLFLFFPYYVCCCSHAWTKYVTFSTVKIFLLITDICVGLDDWLQCWVG